MHITRDDQNKLSKEEKPTHPSKKAAAGVGHTMVLCLISVFIVLTSVAMTNEIRTPPFFSSQNSQ